MGVDYAVKYVDVVSPESDTTDEYDLGCAEPHISTITIRKDQSEASMKDTLVHEMLHIWFRYWLGDIEDEALEERMVLYATRCVFGSVNILGGDFFK